MKKIGLLPRIVIAIVLGVLIGNVLPEGWVRVFVTFNYVFSQFLGFLIPLIIIGLVTPAIADIGRSAGKLLLLTVGLAYTDTIIAGLLAFFTGTALFPAMIDAEPSITVENVPKLQPYFLLDIPPILDVMAALVSSFVIGIGIAYTDSPTLKKGCAEFRTIIEKTIAKAIIPLLPLYIFGIFLGMTYVGEAYHILMVFGKMKNGVSDEIASFCVPLCATIHLSGSMMKITCCALTVCLIGGLPHDLPLFIHFIMLLGICMVAAPGVPGGAVMAALGPMAGLLGFNPDAQALMIALYIAMDSFGTACNVTGDGALAVIINKLHKGDASLPPSTAGLQEDAK